jgi:hypothetical protein
MEDYEDDIIVHYLDELARSPSPLLSLSWHLVWLYSTIPAKKTLNIRLTNVLKRP